MAGGPLVIWNCAGCRATMYTLRVWVPRLCIHCQQHGYGYYECDDYYLVVVPAWP